MKNKTAGEFLLADVRKNRNGLRVTEFYWGTQLSYEGRGKYFIDNSYPRFGGMSWDRKPLDTNIVRGLDSVESLGEFISPSVDIEEGDPMNYAPRSVVKVEFTWEKP